MLSGGKKPDRQVADLAGVLLALKEYTPKHLKEVRDAITEFHASEAAASERVTQAETAEAALKTGQSQAALERQAALGVIGDRETAVKDREDKVLGRERAVDQREDEAAKREQAVEDAERRLRQARKHLEAV